jgi:hypothetical protein
MAALGDASVGEIDELVGCVTAFSCTVVSTTTCSRSLVASAPLLCATLRLSCSSAAFFAQPLAPMGQRVAIERPLVLEHHLAAEDRGSPPSARTSPRGTVVRVPRRRAASAAAAGPCPRRIPRRTPAQKPPSQAAPADAVDLMMSRNGGRLTIIARLAQGLPPGENRTTKESTHQSGNPKTQEPPSCPPTFLQN